MRHENVIVLTLLMSGWATAVWAQPLSISSSQKSEPAEAARADIVLAWEGHTVWGDGDTTGCKSLQLSADDKPMIGSCSGKPEARAFFAGLEQEWADVQNRFAPFTYTSATDRLVFRGRGTLAGPAWQRAVVAWAHSMYGYLYSGRISATGRNVLEWHVNEAPGRPDTCGPVLVVRDIGDAFTVSAPCRQTRGTADDAVHDWLTTQEWEVFDEWLQHWAPLDVGGNRFVGTGTGKMNQKETAELSRWVQSVYARLSMRK